MHFYDEESAELAIAIVKYAMERVKMDPPPLDKPYTLSELQQIVGQTIKPEGRNGLDVLREFVDELARGATISDAAAVGAVAGALSTTVHGAVPSLPTQSSVRSAMNK